MTRKPEIKSINCTSCGAGLDVLGGGRVQVMVCGYCGSELDAQDNFAVLRTFSDLERPVSPFSIGMTGMIEGIPFTIIGTLGMMEQWKKRTWTWVDHQLYSQTHGYAYLTVENGHLSFTRRYRGVTRPGWIGTLLVETSETPPKVEAADGTYTYFETSSSTITFVEGEFNWTPQIGAQVVSVSMLNNAAMLGFQEAATEEEIWRTHYLPAEKVYASFGITDPPKPKGFNVLKPYVAGRHQKFLASAAAIFALIAFVMSFTAVSLSGRGTVEIHKFDLDQLPQEIAFDVSQKDRLARIRLWANVDNSWAFIGVGVTDPDDVPVFESGRTVERYSGRDKDGAWSEGRRTSELRFIPRQTGTYLVEVIVEEAETWQRTGSPLSQVQVVTQEGVTNGRWLQFVGLVFALFGLYHLLRPHLHWKRRMKHGDWSDD
ncbi:DUF4178 domain-containing protein [Sulfitobacter sp.]|uniref:DUF4178 domain-containing protein n=1 Tax=Sulfitobacter sp. TaxID=1903071 RepID=UPI0032972DC3